MPRRLQWSDLQVFLAVHERGSIGAAAQALGINHSTVLRRIGRLEETLQVRLFDRLPSGYALTARGSAFVAGIGSVAEQIGHAERQVTGDDLQLAGSVRLTAPDVFLPLLLDPLREFQQRHPALRIELVEGNAFLNLSRHEADLAVRGSSRPPDNLIARPVGTLQTALYALAGRFTDSELADESAWRWIGHTEALAHLDSARWIERQVPPEQVVLRVDSLAALTAAVAAGLGVGWLLRPLAAMHPQLVELRPAPAGFDTRVWVLCHPELRRVARIKALADALVSALAADPRLRHDGER